MTSRFDEAFPIGETPAWLADFETDAVAAVDALLRGKVYLPGAEDPALALLDWTLQIGEDSEFTAGLDEAVSAWISRHAIGVAKDLDSYSEARAWMAASTLVAYSPDLGQAARALHQMVDRYEQRFATLTSVRGDEVTERFLYAVAVTQRDDRGLAPLWWRLVRLSGSVRPEVGYVGVVGIEHLPAVDGEERGGFRDDVAGALVTYAAFGRGTRPGHSQRTGLISTSRQPWLFTVLPILSPTCGTPHLHG